MNVPNDAPEVTNTRYELAYEDSCSSLKQAKQNVVIMREEIKDIFNEELLGGDHAYCKPCPTAG